MQTETIIETQRRLYKEASRFFWTNETGRFADTDKILFNKLVEVGEIEKTENANPDELLRQYFKAKIDKEKNAIKLNTNKLQILKTASESWDIFAIGSVVSEQLDPIVKYFCK